MAIMVTGGARSGKSVFAEQYAQRTGSSGIYIATCQSYDEEMSARIGMHRASRLASGYSWETIEEPFAAAELLNRLAERLRHDRANETVVLLDCLTLWLTNWLLRLDQDADAEARLSEETAKLLQAVASFPFPLIVVTNEVGDGIVPAYPLGRQFRDEAGRLNQRLASVCERVFLVTAGIPVELKSIAFTWDQL